MRNRRLTPCFNLEDFWFSETAIRNGLDNAPPDETVIARLQALAVQVLEPVRAHFNTRPQISSGYRCPALNAKVGGVPDSQHLTGHAVDFELPGADPLEVARWIRDVPLDYDQLLLERAGGKAWVHVSYVTSAQNRHQVRWYDGRTWRDGLPDGPIETATEIG